MKIKLETCRRWISLAILVFLPLAQLGAHDFWLASSPWNAKPGATITLTANVGDDTFPVSESYTRPERVESVRVIGPKGEIVSPRYRKTGNSLAADITLPFAAATYAIVMSVKGHFLSMPPDKFEEYLKEEGLDEVLAQRARHGETVRPSRERYSRQAKVLVHAGNGATDELVKPAGLVAELVPDSDFTRAQPGDAIGVRLLYQGRPVNNAQIALTSSSSSSSSSSSDSAVAKDAHVVRLRTDSEGRARFTLAGKGPYLVAAVVMVRREGETGPEAADWESYWCSLTFNRADGH